MEWRLVAVRLLMTGVVLTLVWVTASYCSAVYYDRNTATGELLQCVDSQLRGSDVRHWVDEGTLLGIARVKDFIIWDHNVDVAIDRPLTEDMSREIERNCDLSKVSEEKHDGPQTSTFCCSRVCIQLSEHQLKGDTLVSNTKTVPASAVFPATDCLVGTIETRCPKDMPVVLTQAFGSEWPSLPLTTLF